MVQGILWLKVQGSSVYHIIYYMIYHWKIEILVHGFQTNKALTLHFIHIKHVFHTTNLNYMKVLFWQLFFKLWVQNTVVINSKVVFNFLKYLIVFLGLKWQRREKHDNTVHRHSRVLVWWLWSHWHLISSSLSIIFWLNKTYNPIIKLTISLRPFVNKKATRPW